MNIQKVPSSRGRKTNIVVVIILLLLLLFIFIIIIITITRVSVAVEVAGRGERQTEPCVETVETSTLDVAHRPTDDSRRRRLRPNALHANTPSAARGPNICKLRRSYDNATVTIDLRRRTSTLENILRRAQGFP